MTAFPAAQRRALTIVSVSALIAFALYSGLSLARYQAYNVGMFDLGNISQAIWSITRGQALIYTGPTGNVSRLAGHVELIYWLLAPFIWLWPDPRTLLVIQAALAASGALPVYRMAARRLTPTSSAAFAIGYLLFPTAVAAVLFDMHGDTLAMPLLLWMLDALDGGAWRRFWLLLGLSLLCKFYIFAPIGALGLTLLATNPGYLASALQDRRRRQRIGLAVCAAAGVYGALALFGIRPLFTTAASAHGGDYARYYFGGLLTLGLADLLDRAVNLLAVLLPSALLWWWARWAALPALAIIIPAVLSTGPGASYAWSYHHYAAAVPFIVAASIIGASRRLDRIRNPRLRVREARTAGLLFLIASLIMHVGLNDTPLGLSFWRAEPGTGLDSSGYRPTARDALKDRWLRAEVPADASIAASNFLAPHLFQHATLFLTRYPDEPRPQRFAQNVTRVRMVVLDALFDFYQQTGNGYAGGVDYDLAAIREMLQMPGWNLTASCDGLLRFEATATDGLPQSIRQVETTAAPASDQPIALIASSIEPLPGQPRRFHAIFRWQATQALPSGQALVAVSSLDGIEHSRIVHLPSYALQPTTTWQAGQVWEEQFDFELPAEIAPGRYTVRTAWYDVRSPYAAATDARSRVGAELAASALELR